MVITDQARADLKRNALWWSEHHSPEEAQLWHDAFEDQLRNFLTVFPASYSVVSESSGAMHDVRCLRFQGYRALFSIIDNTVYVISVRSGAQARLKPSDIRFP